MDELVSSFSNGESGVSLSTVNSRADVLGTEITPLELDGTVDLLIEMVRTNAQGYVCVANVHTSSASKAALSVWQRSEFRE